MISDGFLNVLVQTSTESLIISYYRDGIGNLLINTRPKSKYWVDIREKNFVLASTSTY